METVLTKQQVIDELVKEAKKLDKLELQILLTKLRVRKIRKEGLKVTANPSEGTKMPTIEQIDRWKHDSRSHAKP